MLTSIAIVTHQRTDLLTATLSSLSRCSLPDGFMGTWVVESGTPTLNAKKVCDSFPRLLVRYRQCVSNCVSAARNTALHEIREGLIIFFDDDVEVDTNSIMEFATAAKKVGGKYIFGGPLLIRNERGQSHSTVPLFFPPSVRGLDYGNESKITERSFFSGGNWAAFASEVISVGGFDPRFGPGSLTNATGSESDLQRRLFRVGCKAFYLPSCVAIHYVRLQNRKLSWFLYRRYRNGIEDIFSLMDEKNEQKNQSLNLSALFSEKMSRKFWGRGRSLRHRVIYLLSRITYTAGKFRGLFLYDKFPRAIPR